MPSKTFYNLPKEKKDKIVSAAKIEFSNHGYSKVSINKIIEKAKISKGSFYMYFNDKKDLLYYILSEYSLLLRNAIINILDKTNGDIFEVFINMYDITINVSSNKKEIMTIFFNTFMSMRSNGIYNDYDINLQELISVENETPFLNTIIKKVNFKKLNIKNNCEFEDLFMILFFVTQKSILSSINSILYKETIENSETLNIDDSRNRFLKMIDLVKNGVINN